MVDAQRRQVIQNTLNVRAHAKKIKKPLLNLARKKKGSKNREKTRKRGGQVIVVNPNGTSQKCSRCGVVAEKKLGLDVRMFECYSCGMVIDRDLNAAKNILKLGLF
ncbi:putative transposase [Candidatus Nitrososphaera gargensis Ga9.2]|uniref:Putative transposase n=1 Tax=Nitrososphaera gargensis (strain Ga9.2) TaxID=1237085 RepID=K0INI9_NITGG|nr:putative transposase [Candidatus Nitrososphaera gargensis Ga9.2]